MARRFCRGWGAWGEDGYPGGSRHGQRSHVIGRDCGGRLGWTTWPTVRKLTPLTASVAEEHMTVDTMQTSIQGLLDESITMAVNAALPLDALRGTAFFDPTRDERLTSLASFARTAEIVATLPHFGSRYGYDSRIRILLQFIYQYFTRIDAVRFDKATFDVLWDDFLSELDETHWMHRGIANLRCFRTDGSPLQPIDLGDGMIIRGRVRAELRSLGFDEAIWGQIAEDWSAPFVGRSQHVLVAEHRIPKEPANLITIDFYSPMSKAFRALQALRLCGAGSVSIGPMWMIRPARFNVGVGGLHRSGFSIPAMGSEYMWTEDVSLAYPAIYGALTQLEKADGYERAPGNLGVALRVFSGIYDRWPSRHDSQLLDAITALEAILGTETELSFRLSFRVAGLLASDDDERAQLFKLMRGFYDTRSKIVHGGKLKQKHEQHLAKIEELHAIVRRLLKSLVAFSVRPAPGYSNSFFREQLDIALLDATEREKVRSALSLA